MTMVVTDQIGELATALSEFQGELRAAKKNAKNPFFKSDYADLESIWDTIRAPLAKHGLSVTQLPSEGGLTTTLLHKSGGYISATQPLNPVKNDPQGMGSAITYARRYALAAILGVVTGEGEDDGNAATEKSDKHTPEQATLFRNIMKSSVWTEEEKKLATDWLFAGPTKAAMSKAIDKKRTAMEQRKADEKIGSNTAD